jgi:hypothetical protein
MKVLLCTEATMVYAGDFLDEICEATSLKNGSLTLIVAIKTFTICVFI